MASSEGVPDFVFLQQRFLGDHAHCDAVRFIVHIPEASRKVLIQTIQVLHRTEPARFLQGGPAVQEELRGRSARGSAGGSTGSPAHVPQGSVNEQGVKQKVPFKRNLLKEIHAELTDDESRAPPSNFELTAAMMHRIILLEKTGGGDREQASGAKLYRNGIEMFDGHFRSFQEQSTQLCMQDLVDDCFPSELQQRFPDGVPFEVQDRRHETFLVRLPWDTCPGEGRAVYEEKDEEFTNAVSLQSPEPNGSGYDILSMHPPCVYSDDMMIQSCGRSANSTVLLQRRKLTGL
uniref:UBX domain-containing protein 11 n=1 Tax=Nothobranchius furzeri TaxID=105023 RepID=A0A1A8AC49_NOTFU